MDASDSITKGLPLTRWSLFRFGRQGPPFDLERAKSITSAAPCKGCNGGVFKSYVVKSANGINGLGVVFFGLYGTNKPTATDNCGGFSHNM